MASLLRFLAVVFAVIAAREAQAHPTFVIIQNGIVPNSNQQLISASPYDNQTLAGSPPEVVLKFALPVRPDKSYIRVYDLYGKQVNDDEVQVDGLTMSAVLPDLRPGRYRVKWKARCQCGDDSELSDQYRFIIQ